MMIVPSHCISTVVGIANRRGSFTTLSSNCTYGRSRIIQAGTDEDDNDDDDFDEDDDYFDDDDDDEENDYFGTCDALHRTVCCIIILVCISTGFVVRHFAGKVHYTITGGSSTYCMLDKTQLITIIIIIITTTNTTI